MNTLNAIFPAKWDPNTSIGSADDIEFLDDEVAF